MEMMHQVWAAGLHDAANCFQDALEAKWKLESQKQAKPKTNGEKIRAMTDRELAEKASGMIVCVCGPVKGCRGCAPDECAEAFLTWLRSPVEESHE